jgi:eukaryotic-like serine/threonine-protein kinase
MLGCTLGHYHIVETIGAGGMGVAYLARDERLNRNVVLKVLPPEAGSDQTARARLVREAQMASALNHPYICTIYEVGEENGFVFIAMEHIEGRTLAASHSPMGPQEVIRYGCQIAEALEHAHSRGIIHRDLKGTNVMLTSEGRVKVLDFGLAKRMRAGELAKNAPTETFVDKDHAAGTLAYMAPEVLSGSPADERADIWALGVMLYEMTAGQRPFLDGTPYQLTSSILRDDPQPLPPAAPIGLATVIVRCLRKEPNQRYQHAGEVRAALEGVQAGSAALTPSIRETLVGPYRLLWIAIALALVLLVGASLYWFLPPRTPIRSIAILPFRGGSGDVEYLTDGLTDSLIDSVSRFPNVKVISRSSAFRYKGQEVDPHRVGQELDVGAVLTGQVAFHGDSVSVSVELVKASDNTHLWGKQYTRKLSAVAAMPSEISQEIGDHLRLHLSGAQRRRLGTPPTEDSEAYRLFLQGMYYILELTPEALETGRQYCEEAKANDPTFVLAYACLSNYYMQRVDDGSLPAREAFPKAKALVSQALSIDPEFGPGHTELGFISMYGDWNLPEAERQFKTSIELTPNWVQAHRGYSICLRAMGRADEAVAADKEARELDPRSAERATSLGWTLYYAHRYPEAIGEFQTSLAMNPNLPGPQQGIAYSYLQRGMEKETIDAFQKFITTSGNAELASEMGQAYARSGFRMAMRKFWQTALDIDLESARRGETSPFIIAGLYSLLGNKDQALSWLEKAYTDHSSKMLDLKVDPDFDNLREDPRFVELVQRVGLP